MDISSGAALLFPVLYFFDLAGWFAAVLPSVICHEIGHLASLHYFRIPVLRIRVEVFGLSLVTAPFSSVREEILCALSGPAAGFMWILPAILIGGDWGTKSAAAALWINLFNLLPALPMDGGRVFTAAAGRGRPLLFSGLLTAAVLFCVGILSGKSDLLLMAPLLAQSAIRQE